MKKQLLFTVTVLFMTIGFAQDSKTSITLAYPIGVGDNSVASYPGVADIGVQYRMVEAGPVHIGISANAAYLSRTTTLGTATIKDKVLLLQPKIFGELNILSIEKLKPFLGVGYTIGNFTTTYESSNSQPDIKNSYGGLNLNLGVAYAITDLWFLHAQYDYTKLSKGTFTNTITLLKLGIGLRF